MANLQIRDVRPDTHAVLKQRAAREGRTLSDLLREELDRIAARPTRRELLDQLAAVPPREFADSMAGLVRLEREQREASLTQPRR